MVAAMRCDATVIYLESKEKEPNCSFSFLRMYVLYLYGGLLITKYGYFVEHTYMQIRTGVGIDYYNSSAVDSRTLELSLNSVLYFQESPSIDGHVHAQCVTSDS